jgi:hypothetical protein
VHKILNSKKTIIISFTFNTDAEQAGIKKDDRLIEINGENIQDFNTDEIRQHIHSIKYPEPLQMLVVDAPTYDYYQQMDKRLHNKLPNVNIVPPNVPPRRRIYIFIYFFLF